MKNNISKAISSLDKKETCLLGTVKKDNLLKDKIYQKVPPALCHTLETAFAKAFETAFLQGTSLIEKTFKKDDISLEFQASDYIVGKKASAKNIKRIDKPVKKSNLINSVFTTSSGLGLGIIGLGLPDIPVLVTTVLKGIYEIALSYGFSYESTEEKIYILRLIKLALCPAELRSQCNKELDLESYSNTTLKQEIMLTSKTLSDSILVEKFIQGIPIVGVIGGFVNHAVYKKISTLAMLKYKKRYLKKIDSPTEKANK